MGKWATYRRRGSTALPRGAALIPRPSPPELQDRIGFLKQESAFLLNPEGLSRLYYREGFLSAWEMVAEDPWQRIKDWGPISMITPGLYYATTVGGGVTYSGESDASNVFDTGL